MLVLLLLGLPPPGGIAIRRDCLFVGWLVLCSLGRVFECLLTCFGTEYLKNDWREALFTRIWPTMNITERYDQKQEIRKKAEETKGNMTFDKMVANGRTTFEKVKSSL